MKERRFIKVEGIVQGVGFRPFVYNLASSLNLTGWVNNNSEGVYIDIEGKEEELNIFLHKLENFHPPLARIDNMTVSEKVLKNYDEFFIKESEKNENKITLISPDLATCADCTADILDPNNRRYNYAFTNCTNCGPRFTIIKSIPYDRDKTTMAKFKMCEACHSEYTDPSYRRFHAQPNACPTCGPAVFLKDKNNCDVDLMDLSPIEFSSKLLKEGKILAIKGLGGFHLCCDALNSASIKELRNRKHRPHKPFAVMVKNLEIAEKYCFINDKERELLSGSKKPIVLLKRRLEIPLPHTIAPCQATLGVMLPYTPLHELLLNSGLDLLIMTSANINGLPLESNNELALQHLSPIADYFLLHNRDIHVSIDDSVVKVETNGDNLIERVLRRARGYVPNPVTLLNQASNKKIKVKEILATGPNMKNTFCIAKEDFLFLSQHNGDLENLQTLEHYKRNIEHFKNIFLFKPKYIAYDLHPHYGSTLYAEDFELPKIGIQHHHAHIVSCMAENQIYEKVIGVAFDGTGYGTDGNIWGGEFLVCQRKNFHRAAHLAYTKLQGGNKSIEEPWRMAVSYIYESYSKIGISETLNLSILNKLYGNKAKTLLSVLKKDINCSLTSSMGRLFDAVSSIIGICKEVTYEGQASIELESILYTSGLLCSWEATTHKILENSYDYSISSSDGYIIETQELILGIIADKLNNMPKELISLKFHNTILSLTLYMCKLLRTDFHISTVALSGGVFQNSYLHQNLYRILKENNFTVYTQNQIPCNDGGIALGQIVIANENI